MPDDTTDADLKRARAAKPAAERMLGDILGQVSIGITRIDGRYGLKVNVETAPRAGRIVPSEIAGVPVRIEVTGPIRKRRAAA
jgi:hypothetical protein